MLRRRNSSVMGSVMGSDPIMYMLQRCNGSVTGSDPIMQKCSGDILEKAGNGSTIGSQQRSEPLELC